LRRVWVETRDPVTGLGDASEAMSFAQFDALQHQLAADLRLAAYRPELDVRVGTGDDATKNDILHAAADYLPLLGVHIAAGRSFTAEEEAADAPVVVISDAYARSHFGEVRSAIGGTVALAGKPVTVIG